MSAYTDDAVGWGCGLMVLLWLLGLLEMFAAGFGWFKVLGFMASALLVYNLPKMYKAYLRSKEPCHHGVVGALHGGVVCRKCKQETRDAEKQEIEFKEHRKQLEKAQRIRAHKEWIANIRMPEYLSKIDPEEFEKLVCELYRKMGYQVEHTSYVGDGGVDGYLRKDGKLSLLQCKRVQGAVGEPVLRDLYGAMTHHKASEGIVVTTGKVSAKAVEWIKNKSITIIERNKLVENIRANFHEDDVVPESFAPVPKGKDFCPKCGNPLRIVKWKRQRFLGCTGYPGCRYTTPLKK